MQVLKNTYYDQLLTSLFNRQDEIVAVTLELLKRSNRAEREKEVNEFILSHPAYPSLLCISDCLSHFNVPHAVARLNKPELENYSLPMIVTLGNRFVVIVNILNDHIVYLDNSGREVKEEKEYFLQQWTGIALLTEQDNQLQGKIRKTPNSRVRKLGMVMTVTGSLMATAITVYSLSHTLLQALSFAFLLTLALAGSLLSGLLVWYAFDKEHPAFKKLCGHGDNSSDCKSILESRYAVMIGDWKWSETGLVYFTGFFLSLLVLPGSLGLIAWLTVAALPYTVFSISYQAFVAKKWCRLCLAVQVVLVSMFITAWTGGLLQNSFSGIPMSELLALLLLFLFPYAVWYFTRPLIKAYRKNRNSYFELARLKHDYTIFSNLLKEQKRIPLPPRDMGILLGNKDAKHTIVKISNPYCEPCAKAHVELKELLDNEDVRIQVIFNATNEPGDKRALPVKHFLAIASKGNEEQTEKAMDDWFLGKKKDYQDFASRYSMNGELKKQDEKVDRMSAWCDATGIAYTPAIFVNGRLLPEIYRIPDLKYILREMK